jgi:hypothetical protein
MCYYGRLTLLIGDQTFFMYLRFRMLQMCQHAYDRLGPLLVVFQEDAPDEY